MPRVDIVVESEVSRSPRARQLEAMFDVPAAERSRLEWHGDVPLDEKPWNVGLIVGPSGCGKSTILRELFGAPAEFEWSKPSVVDDFAPSLSMDEVSATCQSVGFNTIPAWLRPYRVLSNGEQFRVDLARRLLETDGVIAVDEFTSVVDRQVAKIGAHAVQKYVRKRDRKFVAASCHYDIVEWLQPDWTFEPATMTFQWRSVRRRPELQIEIQRVNSSAWRLFSPYHYMSADLHRAATCFVLFVEGVAASFSAILNLPHPRVNDIRRISRIVTLPDYQGIGLASVLDDTLGAAHKAIGLRLHGYPAHPARIRTLDRSPNWRLLKRPGQFSTRSSASSTTGKMGGRPCAVFEYAGPTMDRDQAVRLMGIVS